MSIRHTLLTACTLALSATLARADALSIDHSLVTTTGPAHADTAGNSVHVVFASPFHDPALVLKPAGGAATWDLSMWDTVAVDLENTSAAKQLRLSMTVTTAADGPKTPHEAYVGIGLNPGERRTLRMRLPHRWRFGAPTGLPGVKALDTTKVTNLTFAMHWPFEADGRDLLDCKVSNLRVEGPLTPTPQATAEQYVPFIDAYGQNMHRDWPEKIHTDGELVANREREAAQLANATRPTAWDRFGGWAEGPKLKATGSFRTEKHDGKWYFVDPDGHLFFSQGVDVISGRNNGIRVVPGREAWFQTPPGDTKEYLPTEHNLAIKYGTKDYTAALMPTLQKRLEAWGMNTIGDWSSPDLMLLGGTPYTIELTDYDYKVSTLVGSKRKFYDVFDPSFTEKMAHLMTGAAKRNPAVTRSINDPMCVGYFIDNELNFGNRGKMVLTDEVLKSPAAQASKQELVRDLKVKYGSVDTLNSAWGTRHANWEAVLASTDVPTTGAYHADAEAFFEKTLDQYFRLCRQAVKSAAPNRLYLGCRFISTDAVRPALFKASEKYCDVLSVNIYAFSAANFPTPKTMPGFPDMPVLIGEFQFGVQDRGAFTGSLCPSGVNQTDRATAYTRFLEGALVHPNFVGAHWFQFRDQPLTGRGDGEAYPIGFVDGCDTPYPEMTAAARSVGEHMYEYRAAGRLTDLNPSTSSAKN